MSKIPQQLQYTRTHEWIKKEEDVLTIGITDHAQTMLGDLVYVELPDNNNKYATSSLGAGTYFPTGCCIILWRKYIICEIQS